MEWSENNTDRNAIQISWLLVDTEKKERKKKAGYHD